MSEQSYIERAQKIVGDIYVHDSWAETCAHLLALVVELLEKRQC